jgi:hypothetical protein
MMMQIMLIMESIMRQEVTCIIICSVFHHRHLDRGTELSENYVCIQTEGYYGDEFINLTMR